MRDHNPAMVCIPALPRPAAALNMDRIAVIGAILRDPKTSQRDFNGMIASFKGIVKGRMGIPFDAKNLAVIAITVEGDLDEINSLTGRLGRLPGVTVKTAVSGESAAEESSAGKSASGDEP